MIYKTNKNHTIKQKRITKKQKMLTTFKNCGNAKSVTRELGLSNVY